MPDLTLRFGEVEQVNLCPRPHPLQCEHEFVYHPTHFGRICQACLMLEPEDDSGE